MSRSFPQRHESNAGSEEIFAGSHEKTEKESFPYVENSLFILFIGEVIFVRDEAASVRGAERTR